MKSAHIIKIASVFDHELGKLAARSDQAYSVEQLMEVDREAVVVRETFKQIAMAFNGEDFEELSSELGIANARYVRSYDSKMAALSKAAA